MKTIIFDFDGVIHDTFDLAYKINVEIFGDTFTEENYRDIFNGNIFKNTDFIEKDSNKFSRLQKEAFKYLKIDDNIKNNLEKLSKEYALFIISSNEEDTLNMYFQNNDFTHIFKEVLGLETHKSKVKKFEYLFAKYGIKADDCIFVTDTLGDILEGNKAGVRTIAVDFGFHKRDRLQKGKPFKIVSTFDEILEVINAL